MRVPDSGGARRTVCIEGAAWEAVAILQDGHLIDGQPTEVVKSIRLGTTAPPALGEFHGGPASDLLTTARTAGWVVRELT